MELEHPIKSKTYYVLDKLEFELAKQIAEITPYWNSATEYEKKKLQLLALIVKLGHRNEALAKLLYLKNCAFFLTKAEPLENFKPKRGKDSKGHMPLKFVMKVLSCSHRTAQAYQIFMKGEELANQVFNEGMLALAKTKKKRRVI